jgi:hypothetical protein
LEWGRLLARSPLGEIVVFRTVGLRHHTGTNTGLGYRLKAPPFLGPEGIFIEFNGYVRDPNFLLMRTVLKRVLELSDDANQQFVMEVSFSTI